MFINIDDKRLIPEFSDGLWADRRSERREWSPCRHCHRDVPTFQLAEGEIGSVYPIAVLRCCWECGNGLDKIDVAESICVHRLDHPDDEEETS